MLLALAILVGTPQGWQLPQDATEVLVLRGSVTEYAPVAEIFSNQRIKACNAPLTIGSAETCPKAGRAPPNQTDIWWLKSDVYGVPPDETPSPPSPSPSPMGYARVIADFPLPHLMENNTPIAADVVIRSRLYENEALIVDVPWTPQLRVVRSYPTDETRCYRAGKWADLNRNGNEDLGEEAKSEAPGFCAKSSIVKSGPKAPPTPVVEALQPGETPPP